MSGVHQTAGGELPSVQVGNSEDDISRSPPVHHWPVTCHGLESTDGNTQMTVHI